MRRLSHLLPLVIVALLLAAPAAASATRIRVTVSGDGSVGCTLRAAIDDADSPGAGSPCGRVSSGPDEIVLGEGTYTLTAGQDPIVTAPDLTVVGSGEPLTTISADGISRVFAVAPGASLTVRDLTLSNGQAPAGTSGSTEDPGAVQGGGAILNFGDVTLADTAITNSFAGAGEDGTTADGATGGDGGAIYNAGTLTLLGDSLIGDGAGFGGDGSFATAGSTVTFAGGGEGGNGGAVANVGGDLSVQDSTFIDDLAGSGGQGGAGSSVQGDEVDGGAGGEGGDGGAIWSAAGSVSVLNSTFTSSAAGAGGIGGVAAADGGGGGGGALAADSQSVVTLDSDTIVGNSATGGGGGIFDASADSSGYGLGGISAQNTLLADNAGGNCEAPALIDGGGNLSFGDGTCPAGFRTGNPDLGPLENNGGFGETIAVGTGGAAVGRGAGCPAFDGRGVPRAGVCDIGAYQPVRPLIEVESATASRTTVRIVALVTLDAGSGTVTVHYQSPGHPAHETVVRLGPDVGPAGIVVDLRGLASATSYHYSIAVATIDGSSKVSVGNVHTMRAPMKPRLRRRARRGPTRRTSSKRTRKRSTHPRPSHHGKRRR